MPKTVFLIALLVAVLLGVLAGGKFLVRNADHILPFIFSPDAPLDGVPDGDEEPSGEDPDLDDASGDERIRVDAPAADSVVTSPFTITGAARGPWFFEASFSAVLEDADGNELGIAILQAEGEWMTTEFVPFEGEMTFTEPATDRGVLILEKANPSGLPEHAAEIRINIRFAE